MDKSSGHGSRFHLDDPQMKDRVSGMEFSPIIKPKPRTRKRHDGQTAAGDLQERLEKLQILYGTSSLINATMDPREVISLVLEEAVRIMGATSGSLRMLEPDRKVLRLEVAIGEEQDALSAVELVVGQGVTGWVALHGEPLLVKDVTQDSRYFPVRENVRSELAVPLIIEDRIIGVLNVDSVHNDAFSQTDLELLVALANQSARVIHNAQLHAQIKRKALELASLFSVGQVIVSSLDLSEVLERITQKAVELMEVKLCSLMLLDESGDELSIRAVHGASESYIRKPNLKVADSLLGRVVREKIPLTVEDVRKNPEFKYSRLASEEGLVSLLSVPMIFQKRVVGLLNVYTARPHRFLAEEIELLTALASQSAIAIENARLYESVVSTEEKIRHSERLLILGEIAAEVAHEVRNPLTVIRMLIHSLHEDFDEQDPRKQDTRVIEQKIAQMGHMVDQILQITSQSEPEFQPLDILEVIDDTLTLTRHRLARQKIEFAKHYGRDLPMIYGDRAQLEQALLNLVLNAAQAMPDGGHLSIRTGLKRGRGKPDALWVTIEDTGVGVPEGMLKEIFKPFYTSRSGGIGLGLSIVQRIIKEHRGTIAVQSKVGEGACFTLNLPTQGIQNG
jgi:signal transduction histidine kinase